MKTIRIIRLVIITIVLCLSACSSGDDDPVEPTPTPEVIKPEVTIDAGIVSNGLSFNAAKGENTLSFTTNTDWSLSIAETRSGSTWCTASPTSGSKGTANVKFTTTENTEFEDRSVTVTIKAGTANKTFRITQKAADALLVTTTKYEVPKEGGQIEIEVKSNIDYQMAISETVKEWIAESETKSRTLEPHKHILDIAANEEANKREGEITFKSGNKVETVKVYQAGEAVLLLSQSEYTVSDAGETISVDIKSNVEYDVQMPDVDWIKEDIIGRGMSSHTLKFVIAPNEEYDRRSAGIIFYDKNSALKDTLEVVQAQKGEIVISEKNINVEKEGGTIEVKVNTNVDFEVQIPSDATWISQTDSRGLSEKCFYLEVSENTSDESRSTNVTIADKNSQLSETLIVTQLSNKTALKFAYSAEKEELEGWSEGFFCGEGTYVMGKPHGENGCLITLGNVLEDKGAIVFMDESRQMREIFIDNTIITFGENLNGSVDVSIIEKGFEEKIEHVTLSGNSVQSRSSEDHGQQIGSINLAVNMKELYEVTKDIINNGGFSKRTAIKYLGTKIEGLNNLVRAAGGPDILGDFLGDIGSWMDRAENLVQLGELADMYKAGTTAGGAAGSCVAIYAGLYTTYLELYDEHITKYFGNNQVSIKDITNKGNGLNIELAISGCEPWYDVECGVIVKQGVFPAPRYSDGLATKTVVKDGEYIFVEENVQTDATYYCRPFLITKGRTSLWKGYIGEKVGPLVRYGETVKYDTDELRAAFIKLYQTTNGDNWANNTNWCSDKPLTEWYGVKKDGNQYTLFLNSNKLSGEIKQTFPKNFLIKLYLGSNQLTSIDVSNSSSLKYLDCNQNNLASLDVSDCTSLDSLLCFGSDMLPSYHVASLDVSNCFSLKYLNCSINELTSLDVSSCVSLEALSCNENKLSSLDVSNLKSLKYLSCGENKLSSLDVSNLKSLVRLSCYSNQLTSLDVSNLKSLVGLSCYSNQLTSLDVSNCSSLDRLICCGNELTFLDVSNCTLLETLECNNNNLTSLNVANLTSLESLHCYYNDLTSLNVANLTSLESLHCSYNDLTSLDISGCISLKYLSCSDCLFSSLDVSSCVSLESLVCNNNNLTSLDVSNCSSLVGLDCTDGQVAFIDASNCTSLKSLYCGQKHSLSLNISGCLSLVSLSYNEESLVSLDISGCTKFKELVFFNCNLKSFKASGCTFLQKLNLESNQLVSVDVSGCNSLERLNLGYNQLTSLDVSGCNSLKSLYLYSNQLTFLDISDCTSLESLNCGSNQLTSLDVSNLRSLSGLDCYSNQLTSLDVSNLRSLSGLSCDSNQLTSLDVSNLESLVRLSCGSNQLTSLDVSNLKSLEYLSCYGNQLSSLDVSGLAYLRDLECHENQLTSLSASGCTSLSNNLFTFYSNPLTILDLSDCISLEYLKCGGGKLVSIDVSGCTSLSSLNCSYNQLISIDVSGCILYELNCSNNKICSEIPDYFDDNIRSFYHDQRYTYTYYEDENGNTKIKCIDNGVGWWYPGEPDIPSHERH